MGFYIEQLIRRAQTLKRLHMSQFTEENVKKIQEGLFDASTERVGFQLSVV